jgi:hypothetical protein
MLGRYYKDKSGEWSADPFDVRFKYGEGTLSPYIVNHTPTKEGIKVERKEVFKGRRVYVVKQIVTGDIITIKSSLSKAKRVIERLSVRNEGKFAVQGIKVS